MFNDWETTLQNPIDALSHLLYPSLGMPYIKQTLTVVIPKTKILFISIVLKQKHLKFKTSVQKIIFSRVGEGAGRFFLQNKHC